jgi:Uma2 family endonuclease
MPALRKPPPPARQDSKHPDRWILVIEGFAAAVTFRYHSAMTQHPERHYSLDEYFSIEEMSEVRHEYSGGEIFAMSGGSRNHNQIAQNLTRAFDSLRSKGCRSYLTDVRLKTPAGLYTYPDVMAISGPAALTGDRLETVTNPVVLAEVLSASTRDYDCGQKFDLYRAIPTLRDCLLVDQYAVEVEHRWLDGAVWRSDRHTHPEDRVKLTGVPVTLVVEAMYELVER